ncbi:MAG: hypothetical protein ACRC2B_17990 [Rubrivivax sp.]
MTNVRTPLLLVAVAAALSGCYIVPVRAPDGTVVYDHYPLPPVGSPMPAPAMTPAPGGGQMPAVLTARLYPSNDLAAQSGVVSGTVTNMMTGKGRFQVNYMGEVLNGEATRVSNEDKRGVASAYSPRGTYMSCDYQMTTPFQGTGDCRFSNGATYTLHLGGN